MAATEFFDKSKKQIYAGDIVQYKLNNLRDGGRRGIVVQGKNDVKICWLKGNEYNAESGWVIRKTYEPHITILDTSNREL